MSMHKIVKALVSSGIAASVVTGMSIEDDDAQNTIEAAQSPDSTYYKYEGSTGVKDGDFIIDENFVDTLKNDGTLNFNGYDIAPVDKAESNDSEIEEVYDQHIRIIDQNTASGIKFPVKDETVLYEDVLEAYGHENEVYAGKVSGGEVHTFEVGEKSNIITFKTKNGYVVETAIGHYDIHQQ